jgi:acetylglutamate kinase
MTVSPHDIAHILSEALPHMQRYDEETVVVKYGGPRHGPGGDGESFARDIVLLEQTAINPVVVHGGGPQIGEMPATRIKSEFAGDCASLTRPRSRSLRWCWPARSTNRSSASSTRPAARRSVCGGRQQVTARKISRTIADPFRIEKVVDWLRGRAREGRHHGADPTSAAI